MSLKKPEAIKPRISRRLDLLGKRFVSRLLNPAKFRQYKFTLKDSVLYLSGLGTFLYISFVKVCRAGFFLNLKPLPLAVYRPV